MRIGRLTTMLLALVLMAQPARAQDDSDLANRSLLLQRIQDRFSGQVKEELGLNDVQAARMKETTANWFIKRRELEGQERRLRQSLAGQLRPGVAASRDSVNKLVERLLALKVTYAESFREEDRELSAYLDPVQRGQYFVLRERLLDRVQEARQQNPRRRMMLR